jgi:hypothetical protein
MNPAQIALLAPFRQALAALLVPHALWIPLRHSLAKRPALLVRQGLLLRKSAAQFALPCHSLAHLENIQLMARNPVLSVLSVLLRQMLAAMPAHSALRGHLHQLLAVCPVPHVLRTLLPHSLAKRHVSFALRVPQRQLAAQPVPPYHPTQTGMASLTIKTTALILILAQLLLLPGVIQG